jgi:hypothetical protein
VEGVSPTASEKTLGSGTYQVNATALLVQAWSPTLITAFVARATQSVHEFNQRKSVQENSVRVVQAFILPRGFFFTLDGRYNWETINKRDCWWDAQATGMLSPEAGGLALQSQPVEGWATCNFEVEDLHTSMADTRDAPPSTHRNGGDAFLARRALAREARCGSFAETQEG